jgi:hypothetical protein
LFSDFPSVFPTSFFFSRLSPSPQRTGLVRRRRLFFWRRALRSMRPLFGDVARHHSE